MADSQIRHRYSFLNPLGREIRLVTLFPGPETADIECILTHVSLNEKPHYEALSYTWGEHHEKNGNILLEDHPFPITSNLELALRYLRSETDPRSLWIDALSINQVDDEEKSHLVRNMRSVYELAARVIIWLGEAEYNSDSAMDLVEKIGNTGVDQFEADEKNSKPWDALADLFRRRWWSRVWVIQEATISKVDPVVGCGHKWVPWHAFALTLKLIESQLHLGESGSRMILQAVKSQASAIKNLRQQLLQDSPAMRIEPLMRLAMTFEATDPRDQLYALGGLAAAEDRHLFSADYTKTTLEIYTEFALGLLSQNFNTIFINTASPHHQLPSWVSDWSWSTRCWPLWLQDTYHACGTTKPAWRFSTPPHTLSIPGLLIDHVHVTDELIPRGGEPTVPYRKGLPVIVDSIENLLQTAIAQQSPPNVTTLHPIASSDVLWRTLLANKTLTSIDNSGQKTPVPPAYGEMFQVYRGRADVPSSFKPDVDPERRKELFIQPFELCLQCSMEDQRFFITGGGRVGIGPRELRAGNLVVVFWGADMPVLLREGEEGEGQRLLGAGYVHGVMEGEAFNGMTEERLRECSEVFMLR